VRVQGARFESLAPHQIGTRPVARTTKRRSTSDGRALFSGGFATALDADAIRANRRLFMTATPRYLTGTSRA
jgi:predicted helicase